MLNLCYDIFHSFYYNTVEWILTCKLYFMKERYLQNRAIKLVEGKRSDTATLCYSKCKISKFANFHSFDTAVFTLTFKSKILSFTFENYFCDVNYIYPVNPTVNRYKSLPAFQQNYKKTIKCQGPKLWSPLKLKMQSSQLVSYFETKFRDKIINLFPCRDVLFFSFWNLNVRHHLI